ncbi:hypothetical protein N9I34_00210 [Gammaproteobacteria bacterium]|nr:hypothetical protein [Gammaproteobacteria bacterium]
MFGRCITATGVHPTPTLNIESPFIRFNVAYPSYATFPLLQEIKNETGKKL